MRGIGRLKGIWPEALGTRLYMRRTLALNNRSQKEKARLSL